MNNVIVTFGEIMGRIDMPGKQKVIQSLPGEVSFNFAGAEASVAVSLSYLGKKPDTLRHYRSMSWVRRV